MESIIMNFITDLSSILITLILGIVGYLTTIIGNDIKKWFDEMRISNYVIKSVECVNQVYKDKSNEEKFEQAKKDILEWLKNENLKINDCTLRVLIESSVKKMKGE